MLDASLKSSRSFKTKEVKEMGDWVECGTCDGTGVVTCGRCDGDGQMEHDGKYEDCYQCGGDGEQTCVICHGKGENYSYT
ncbi:MAG: hypothetical protein HYS87_01985 [Candidatus Colwellbacteria bacterium]|nr:hypothetical protein [Candidatus Colwellbacteria bacterium]